jgi:hypothetical protein
VFDYLSVFTYLCVVPAAERPREHAVDAEVFAQLAQCGLAMIMHGQAVNKVRDPCACKPWQYRHGANRQDSLM